VADCCPLPGIPRDIEHAYAISLATASDWRKEITKNLWVIPAGLLFAIVVLSLYGFVLLPLAQSQTPFPDARSNAIAFRIVGAQWLAAANVALLLALLVMYCNQDSWFTAGVRKRRYVPLRERHPKVFAMCESLRQRMLPNRAIHVWVQRYEARSRLPSVLENSSGIHLLLPLGLVRVFSERPEHVRAMVAHELAHVRQRDVRLFQYVQLLRRWQPFFYAAVALSLSSVAFGFEPNIIGLIVVIVIYRRSRRALLSARQHSEWVADLGAAAFGHAEGLLAALAYTRETRNATGAIHPPRQVRAAQIRGVMRTYLGVGHGA